MTNVLGRPWTTEETSAVMLHFGEQIAKGHCIRKNEFEAARKIDKATFNALKDRTWAQVKLKAISLMTSFKSRRFKSIEGKTVNSSFFYIR